VIVDEITKRFDLVAGDAGQVRARSGGDKSGLAAGQRMQNFGTDSQDPILSDWLAIWPRQGCGRAGRGDQGGTSERCAGRLVLPHLAIDDQAQCPHGSSAQGIRRRGVARIDGRSWRGPHRRWPRHVRDRVPHVGRLRVLSTELDQRRRRHARPRSADDAEQQSGITQQQVSRWRHRSRFRRWLGEEPTLAKRRSATDQPA
jgi:hypothetical protein